MENTSICPVCASNNHELTLKVLDHSISKETFELVRCRECGFTWTKDAPGEDKIGPYYASEDYISHSDKKESLTDHLYHRARGYMLNKKSNLINKISDQKKGRLLDYGSGTGYFAHHANTKGWDVQGIEINEEARNQSIKQFGINVNSPDQLDKIDLGSLDVITLWHVLEHIHKLNSTLTKFYDLLQKGGHLIIAVPNHDSHDAEYYQDFWAAYDVPRHLWHFRPSDMKKLGEKHGFTLALTQSMPFDSFYVSILSEQYKKSGLATIKGIYRGLISNIKSGKDGLRCSSTIYVFKKN